MAFKILGAALSPFVRKTRVYFAEKGIPYDLDPIIPFAPPADWKTKSPLGRIPCLEHDGRFLPDSSVICQYVEKLHPTPPLYPSDPWEFGRALWFEEYIDGGFVANAMAPVFFERIVKKLLRQEPDPARIQAALDKALPEACDYLTKELGDNEYVVGNRFTIADIAVAGAFVNLAHAGVPIDAARWPKLAAYVERIQARPSFKPLIEEERAALPK
jgi:glutathione S-transferase